MEMPRRGFAGAVTCTPSACSRLITSFQLEPSAKAPCTRTTVGRDASCGLCAHGFLLSLPYSGTHASSTSNKSTLGNLSCHLTRTLMTGRWVNRILRGAGSGAALAPRATLPSLGNA